ncbi:MAG TPA: transglutaminase family protein [Solirubrobacteraceae bacterium]|jgi:transglutaminase-like putative cysteine protease|nr:transglutaminase family protein [Solirubrobacteraceae bacterium]
MYFAIRYLTRYQYDVDVVDNINMLRVCPAANGRQRIDDFTVRLTPDARQYRHEDYFGTEVVEFEVARPHRELVIDVRARVTTQPQSEPSGTTWEGLSDTAYREAGGEFLLQTDDANGHPLLTALQGEVANATTPLEAVMLVSELIPNRFEYRKGATYVDSPLIDVLEGEAGVCQDFVHLGLNLLRHHGIAARYVSGYLYTAAVGEDDTAETDGDTVNGDGESVEVDTHAWIEALLPGDGGEPHWASIDPTNCGLAGEHHVKIGHGRHYADVPPIKGIYRGAAIATLEASVTMTRSDGPDPASAARA